MYLLGDGVVDVDQQTRVGGLVRTREDDTLRLSSTRSGNLKLVATAEPLLAS